MTDPHRPYTLWFVYTPSGRLRLVIWPRKGIVHAVLQGSDDLKFGDFDTVEEAEQWGYQVYGSLYLNESALARHFSTVQQPLNPC